MTDEPTKHDKISKPHAAFDEPLDVVADAELSKAQKAKALDALEQDARQLSIAASEGMTGGEPTGLQDVLNAKDTLAMPPLDQAYDLMLHDLRARQKTDLPPAARAAVEKALTALEAGKRLSEAG